MAISDVLKARRSELGFTLLEIAKKMGVSEATVQRWESGNIKTLRQGRIAQLAEILKVSPAYLMGWEDQPYGPKPVTVKKPRLGRVACGEPILAEENIEGYDDVPDFVDCDFTLTCEGDSMIGARIYDGDTVYVRLQEIVENGQIAVVRIGEETTLKRFYRNGDTVTLMPENPKYAPLVFINDQINEIRILGRAVAFTSMIK